MTAPGASAAQAKTSAYLRTGGKGFIRVSRDTWRTVFDKEPEVATQRLSEQYIEDKDKGGPDKRAGLAYEFLSGVMSSLTLEEGGGKGTASGRSVKAETFEGRPVFTYADPSATLRITQERPYRLVSVSQNKPSADGSQIKLIYFSEEGKLTHPLSAPAAQDLAPGSAQMSYRLAVIQAKLNSIEDSMVGQ